MFIDDAEQKSSQKCTIAYNSQTAMTACRCS